MEKRQLGKTGLPVTVLGYGAMELRHVGESEAGPLLNAVLDSGINYIDTSPDYGPSEAYIGKAIGHRRQEFYLASKCGCNIDDVGKGIEPRHIWTRQRLAINIENSLRLLKTDHLDVWQLHGTIPDELAGGKHDDVIAAMQELKRQGKVRFIGISFKGGSRGRDTDALYPAGYGFKHIAEFMSWDVFDVMQIVYGGLTRQSESQIAAAARQGIGIIVRGVVRKYQDNYDEQFAAARLGELCQAGESSNDFLVRFALSHSGVSTMIIGTKNVDHLRANAAAVERGKLSRALYAEAKRRLSAIGVGPGAQ